MYENIIIYKEPGRFGGWPANSGIWSWGDEIVVGFVSGYFQRKAKGHAIDNSKPSYNWQARSLDGGKAWLLEKPDILEPFYQGGKQPEDFSGGIDFKHPDFAMTCRRSGIHAGSVSWFLYSYDRCKTWNGPYKIPMFGQKGIAARTDYAVISKDECIVFLTATKSNGREGRVFCAQVTEGGASWKFLSWITPEPKGYTIMPSHIQLPSGRLLVSVRCADNRKYWIDNYISDDGGKSWSFLNTPVEDTGPMGNPASMILLKDGRICITYGYRSKPYGIRAKVSNDSGITWGEEIILRDDAGCWDLGYPRSVQRSDEKIVTTYYYNDSKDEERYIAATIWDLDV